MRVLVSAYACEPGRGSEPEAGWQWVRGAAQRHEVWVMTHATNTMALSAAIVGDPCLEGRVHPVFLRAPRWARPLRRRGPTRFLYYLIWQLTVCRTTARTLRDQVGFDVMHHVTYASDWAPSGLAGLGVPFVWGPVGGASTPPLPCLWRRLGTRVGTGEALRFLLLSLLQRTCGRTTAARAAVVVGQNGDVVDAFPKANVIVEPNIALADVSAIRHQRLTDGRKAVFAGRLLGWKGLDLALEALGTPAARSWRLDVYGDGPERARLTARAQALGLADRVQFLGHRPRTEVIAAISKAQAYLFPSLHDSAGWSVAEAMASGCPVVALDVGGPRTVVGHTDGILLDARSPTLASDMAEALEKVVGMEPAHDTWSADRLPARVDDLYRRAVEYG